MSGPFERMGRFCFYAYSVYLYKAHDMSSVVSIDKKIANYVEQLSVKQKKAVLSVVKAFAEEGSDDVWEDEAIVNEMSRRTKELESSKVKGYSWDEVKKVTRKSLSEMKRK